MKKKMIWGLVIGAVLIASLIWVFSNRGMAVDVAKVGRGDIKKYVEDIGTVKCKEQKTVSIEGSGRIETIAVEVGQQVKKGDILLTMEKEQLEIQLKDADEKIKEIEASFQGSEIRNYATQVEKGRIAVRQAEDAYGLASDDFNNTKMLYEAGAVSRYELNQKESALKNAQALLNTAQIQLQEIENNTPESIRAAYKAQMEQAALNRESTLLSLKKQEIVSPIDGIILERNVETNTVGMPGTIAFVIGNIENIEVEAYILADDVTDVKLGDEVELTERSERKQVISGKVTKIAPSATTITSSLGVNQKKVSVTIAPLKQITELKPGYEVDIKVITQRKNNVIMVPVSAVFDYQGKSCVFVVESGKAVLRTIQKGIQDELFVEIVDGLKEGELVLSEPDNSIREGMKIKPIEPKK
ncbi:HlyD family secretion protein [Anaerosolibacter carboniphilus]|uniref:HlyD family secretion protein n=1 Tax=Anaerosolibacter carboniphilus TaxID=1417629 RepID=A0A841L667_9FIRM|nr:efflux RND transporter periplasmic adaptor subunit [Anaerosolibacter carboniphilus]MBB6218582.1 HlyD family secretion protein [Anaerosolibacter carboniphilus]